MLVSLLRDTYRREFWSSRWSSTARLRIAAGWTPALDVEPPSDAALVRQLVAGSEDALATLYDRHSPAVFSAALRYSGDRAIAAEVLQDTFMTLWNRAEQFDSSRGSLVGWLSSIAHNRAIDHLRTARRRGAAPFSSFGDEEADERRGRPVAGDERPAAGGSPARGRAGGGGAAPGGRLGDRRGDRHAGAC